MMPILPPVGVSIALVALAAHYLAYQPQYPHANCLEIAAMAWETRIPGTGTVCKLPRDPRPDWMGRRGAGD